MAPPADYGTAIGGGGGGGGGESEISPADDSYSVEEDDVLEGNVFDNDETSAGTLRIRNYRVLLPGYDVESIFVAGEQCILGGIGVFVLGRDGAFEFTPAANFSGDVPEFEYEMTNGHEVKVATLNITVTAVNDGPTAGDASGLSFEGEAVEVDLLSFAVDPDGDTLTVTHLNGAAVSVGVPVTVTGGTLTYLGAGVVEVAPDSEDEEPISFTYTVSDGTLSDTGDAVVQVGVVNGPMVSPVSPLLGTPMDTAALNFGKTYRRKWGPTDDNGVNVTAPPYSAGQGYFAVDSQGAPIDREPWLYDRATTLYLLAKRTNNPTILAEAMSLARRYFAGVVLLGNGQATFNIIGNTGGDPTDVKYLYGIVALWYEKETLAAGGTTEEAQIFRTKARGLYLQTLQSFTQTYNGATAELWTERNAWAAITNCLAWYWISGDQNALDDATAYVENVLLLAEDTGSWLHSKDKHESDGDPTLIISPWMSGLLCEALLQYHRTTDSVGLSRPIPEVLSRFGDWMVDNAFYVATGSEEPELVGLAGLRIPAYLVGDGAVQFPEGEAADMEHCCDVAEVMRKVKWAKTELSESTTEVDDLISELEDAAVVSALYWTRTTEGYPHYRVNPPRKYGWQYRCRYSYVHSIGIVPFPPSLTTAPVVTGSTQAGSTLTCSTGVWAGTPTPTFTYQWQHRVSGVWSDVADTDNQYVTTTEADNGVRCAVTATNAGGALVSYSNVIEVVVAGSPEITVQPTNAQALVGETAVFSITATGTPTPTYQWQVNDGGGWANVAEGTGGTTNSYTTETLDGADDGDLYRCNVTNAGGTVTSDVVTLTMVVAQEAASFADSTDFGSLAYAIGGAGFTEFTVGGWIYLDNVVNNAGAFVVEGIAGRMALLQYSSSGVAGIGDSNTGTAGGAFDVAPPQDEWIFAIFRGVTTHPGTFTAYWYDQDGVLGGSASRANGIEGSVGAQALHLNGGDLEPGLSMRAQYIRAYNRRLTDEEVEVEFSNIDMGTTGLVYFNVFEDDGGGGISVRDATGNNREFTLVGATLSALGPIAPSV